MNRLWLGLIIVFTFAAASASPANGQSLDSRVEPKVEETQVLEPCFAPIAEEIAARPVKGFRLNLKWVTFSRSADADETSGSRSALSAGETPAVPGKRSTPATQADAPKTTTQADGNQSTNTQKTDDYVFPTREERAKRYVKSMFGPSALLRSAVLAGINQWQDSPQEWEQGMSGYGKRFASNMGRIMIQQTVIYGLDSALGWDTGFRRSGKDKFGERLKHALLENVTSRTKSGKRVFSVPRVAGPYTSGVISREAWYPERYSWKDGLRAGNNTMLMGFALNVVREFLVNF